MTIVGLGVAMVVAAIIRLWVWFFTYGMYHMEGHDPEGEQFGVAIAIATSVITLVLCGVTSLVLAWTWLEWALKTSVEQKPPSDEFKDL